MYCDLHWSTVHIHSDPIGNRLLLTGLWENTESAHTQADIGP